MLVELAPVVVYLREAQAKGFGDKTRVSLHYHMKSFAFLRKISVEGDLLRVICILGGLGLTAELHWNVKAE